VNRRRRRAIALGLAAIGYALVVRPRMMRSGATEAEIREPFPGAEVVPGGKRGATMATTIDAPPAAVWPWLVQMGCDRAGWYSWDRLDNGAAASADRVHPEWQQLELGDRLASTPSGSAWFEVAALQPERFLALRAAFDLRGRPFDPAGTRPRFYNDSIWCFLLAEQPPNRTRLVVSGYGSSQPRALGAVLNFVFWEPTHWIMQRRQFTNLRRRIERGKRAEVSGDSAVTGAPGANAVAAAQSAAAS
jgi:hypothetical protein